MVGFWRDLVKKIVCSHDWMVIDEKLDLSVIERMRKVGLTNFSCGLAGHNLTKRVFMQTMACKKCGKLVIKKTLY